MTTNTETLRVVGTSQPQGEGPAKVTGACHYTADLQLPGMLWGKTVRSPYPHARILRIDTSRAQALAGVRAIITGADIPHTLVGLRIQDVPVLATDRVRFAGEKVAAVAADDAEIAEQAVALIDVEYEELPAVFDPIEAMQEGAPVLHENPAAYKGALLPLPPTPNLSSLLEASKGDVEQGLAESDLVFEHTFVVPPMHQGYIEPHGCVVQTEADGSAQVWATNKAIFTVRTTLAAVAGVPEEQIRVYTTHIGGDFGGKHSSMDIPLAYFLSQRTGRPVKMIMDYAEEMTAANIRHPAVVTVRTGVKRDGRLWAQDVRIVFNSGAYAGFKASGNLGALRSVGGSYRIPNVRAASLMVYTNTVPGGFMRTPGVPQFFFAVESQIEIIARELGMDPLKFRLKNAVREGDTSALGGKLEHVHCVELLEKAAEASGWRGPKAKPNVGRGLALYDRKAVGGNSTVVLTLEGDGSLTATTGIPDQGVGLYTVIRQIAAEVLGLDAGEIRVRAGSTAEIPPESGIGGSKATYVTGQATLAASQQLRDHLLEVAETLLDVYADEIELTAGGFRRRGDGTAASSQILPFADVAAEAVRLAGGPVEAREKFDSGDTFITNTSFCAQVAEVAVDRDTGEVKVLSITTAHDVGTVINPMMHDGQIEGGAVQALGYALMEELQTEGGRITNANLGDYKLPTTEDLPELRTVVLEDPTGPAPYGGRAIGEIANVPLAAAIANAVQDAVGVRILTLPVTAEKVYNALHGDAGGAGAQATRAR